ncbi:hypothetical protein H1D32_07360 [Anaerobacillus sp. CMMVII]|uniref:hypothetical protein n=1 Tax=Anaerobacillus sp. CMMVII TaxID=2755588 RepID=UPI0021B7762D|nr:hypothetical protein [Anaerobacillus sp. CMMVII]MCT8137578.1 hypothetical protein [Anaerobacillus sp. CMMVII]
MTNRHGNRKEPHTAGDKGTTTEFGTEMDQCKKARKRAARESCKMIAAHSKGSQEKCR